MTQTTSKQGPKTLLVASRLGSFLRAGRAVVLISAGVSSAHAAFWENYDWALSGDLGGSVTYDSNIFAFKDGGSDTIIGVQPGLTLQRKGSLTDLKVITFANFRYFMDNTDQDSIDPSILINLVYPNTDEALIKHQAHLGWSRLTYPDYSVGNRIERKELMGDWNGTLRDNGKTRIIAKLNGSQTNYPGSNYEADVDAYGGGLGLAWSRHELLEYTATLDYQYSKYGTGSSLLIPGGTRFGNSTRDGVIVNVGLRGEITPKIKGEATVGVGKDSYKGAIDGSSVNWFSGINLNWKPIERRMVTFSANRGTYFDALGTAYNRLDGSLTYKQELAGGFSAYVTGGFGEYDYSESGILRKDRYFQATTGLEYDLTGRFAAGVELRWMDRSSDIQVFNFSEYETIIRASWHF